MHVTSVVGARPELIKVAAVSDAFADTDHTHRIRTGQHYDRQMSQQFVDELQIPEPDVDHASDLLLAPTEAAMANLRDEGLAPRAVNVGDLHADTTLRIGDEVAGAPLDLPGSGVTDGEAFVLATIHRAENTDDLDRLTYI